MTSEWSYLRSAVPTLDPLGLDDVFDLLPRLAGRSRVRWLLDVLQRVPSIAPRDADPAILHAMLRDTGMLLAALRGQGLEPIPHVPGLDQTLVEMGVKARHVPREAIFHYTAFNPPGGRRRRFSSNPQEDRLIDAVTVASDSIVLAIFALIEATRTSFASVDFLDACQAAERELSRFLVAMIDVVRSVAPEFFAETLRPNWEPVRVADIPYDGPGPVQLPIFIVDRIIWAANNADVGYASYVRHNMAYTLEEFRNFPNVSLPLTESYFRWSASYSGTTVTRQRTLAVLASLMNFLVKFRRVHCAFAFRAYAVRRSREPGAVGSSGHGPEVLPSILKLTENAQRRLLIFDETMRS